MGKKSDNAGASFTATAYKKGGEVYTDPRTKGAMLQATKVGSYSVEDMTRRAQDALNMGLGIEIENHQ